ncbi:MAG TPA: hypothetical protein VF516_01000 [Kofleriaceae bacterium]
MKRFHGILGLRWLAIAALLLLPASITAKPEPDRTAALAAALRVNGRPPAALVAQLLDAHDLLIFDDAVHDAHEPWVFYQALVRAPDFHRRVKWIFLETLPVTAQPKLDRYVQSPVQDLTLLERAFQDDYSGTGWPFQDTLDLIEAVRQVNQALPHDERLRCVAVSPPIYWEALHTRADYDRFLDTLDSRDYAMYLTIRRELDGFHSGRKGVFLTNTRHAYNGLRTRDGRTAWNTAAFFHHWDPGKTCSIRIHNLALQITPRAVPAAGPRSAQGLDDYSMAWVRVDGGAWDAAFARNGNAPVAIVLAGTPFAAAPFVGPGALSAAPDLELGELYDATIFLSPMDRLHESARTVFYFTPAFKRELKRRLGVLNPGGADDLRKTCGVDSVDACVDKLAVPSGVKPARRDSPR